MNVTVTHFNLFILHTDRRDAVGKKAEIMYS